MEERQAVLDAILNMNHFPAGMELFPASDSTPWEVIERVIDDSDYYILIVGGSYGSTTSSGISFTEREYDYARNTNKPVLAFLHQNPLAIPAGKVEMEPAAQKNLGRFREKLQNHHCKYWNDAKELQYKVAISLIQEINIRPATGWIRATEASNEELLRRIERLTKENEQLRELYGARTSVNAFHALAGSTSKRSGKVKLFYSYAHADEALRQELEKHLSILIRAGLIESWSDRKILPGSDFDDQIDESMENADIILFLVSADFMASDYLAGKEVKRALERQKEGKTRVIPVILRPVDWMVSRLGKLQALPQDGRPITTWSDQDSAFTNVVQGIQAVVFGMRD
jgi:hypothetical protein